MMEKCQACGQSDLLATKTSAKGGYGPDLLPGTGIFKGANFQVVVCTECGFVHFYVHPDDLHKVKSSKHFRPLR